MAASFFSTDKRNILWLSLGRDPFTEPQLLHTLEKLDFARDIPYHGGFASKVLHHKKLNFAYWNYTGRCTPRPIIAQHLSKTDCVIFELGEKLCHYQLIVEMLQELTSKEELRHASIFLALLPREEEKTEHVLDLAERSEVKVVRDVREELSDALLFYPGQTLHVRRVQAGGEGDFKTLLHLSAGAASLKRREREERGGGEGWSTPGAGQGGFSTSVFRTSRKIWDICRSVLFY